MNYLKNRQRIKEIKNALHTARHARNMREDIADPADLAALKSAEEELKQLASSGEGSISRAMEKLIETTEKIYPSKLTTGTREMVEVVIVALGAAMAIRAFFFQPYKIPTGSMQPTLNGIIATEKSDPGLLDRQPFLFVKWLLTGESYKEIRVKASGRITAQEVDRKRNALVLTIGGKKHLIPASMKDFINGKAYYEKGDILAQAKLQAGDHIIVNKMKYNFMKPQRGDIAVFDTRNITHEDIQSDTFYIKRMVGMPGETIQIKGNRLLANGNFITEPAIFKTIETSEDYHGHALRSGSLLEDENDAIALEENHYLMMGDNTYNSLDGRYFGGVHRLDFQGPAFFVYWPFGKHWGLIH
jgi:signal peptidase I